MLSREQLQDLNENFPTVSESGSGFLPRSDVQTALKILGIDVPGYKVGFSLSSDSKIEFMAEKLSFLSEKLT